MREIGLVVVLLATGIGLVGGAGFLGFTMLPTGLGICVMVAAVVLWCYMLVQFFLPLAEAAKRADERARMIR